MKPIFFIDVFGGVDTTDNEQTAEQLYLAGNYFEDEAKAIEVRNRIKAFLQSARAI